MNADTLSFAVLLLTGAALGERLGRPRILAAGVVTQGLAWPWIFRLNVPIGWS